MWLFNNPPQQDPQGAIRLRRRPTTGCEHLQQAAVRFNSGGSGSFVSPDGLVMTNHHVGAARSAEAQHQGQATYVKTGLLRQDPGRGSEVPRPGAQRAGEHRGRDRAGQRRRQARDADPADAEKARRAAMNDDREGIAREDRPAERRGHALSRRAVSPLPLQEVHRRPPGLRARAGRSPSSAAIRTTSSIPATTSTSASSASTRTASRPRSTHYLKWSRGGAEGRRTGLRLRPSRPHRPAEHRGAPGISPRPRAPLGTRPAAPPRSAAADLTASGARRTPAGPRTTCSACQNSRKARLRRTGRPAGPGGHGPQKRAEEKAFRAGGRPTTRSWQTTCGDAWDDDRQVARTPASAIYTRLRPARTRRGLPQRAVRHRPDAGPPGRGDGQAQRRPAPRVPRVEPRIAQAGALLRGADLRRPGDGQAGRLAEHVRGDGWAPTIRWCKRCWPASRRASGPPSWSRGTQARRRGRAQASWPKAGCKAIEASDDPMIQLARLVDPAGPGSPQDLSRRRSKSRMRQAYAKIAKARFALYGTDVYPDATFTLRLAFGAVKGYEEDGQHGPALDHHRRPLRARRGARQPAAVRSAASAGSSARTSSTSSTPFNFVCTADIIGGNSGSPVVNRDGEFVGIIFDGNIQSLVWDFVYTDKQGRAVGGPLRRDPRSAAQGLRRRRAGG